MIYTYYIICVKKKYLNVDGLLKENGFLCSF